MWRRVLGGLPVAAVIAGTLVCAPTANAEDVTITPSATAKPHKKRHKRKHH